MNNSPASVMLEFERYGASTGHALVIAHGLFGSSTNWRGIAKILATRYQIYTLDLRNHGQSPWAPRHDYPALAADIHSFLRREVDCPYIAIGHSMGGKATMQLALAPPPRGLSAIVIVDIAPVRYSHTHAGFIEAMQSVDLATLNSRQAADCQLADAITDPAVRQFLLQNLVNRDGHWRWRINLDALSQHQDALSGFDEASQKSSGIPALFIYGTASNYVDEAGQREALRRFPNAQFEAFAGAGHWLHAEQPKKMIDVINRFAEVQFADRN